ncbi:unnamed protein product [Arctogadus glacialis]
MADKLFGSLAPLCTSVECLTDDLNIALSAAIDSVAPIVTKKRTLKKPAPWFNAETVVAQPLSSAPHGHVVATKAGKGSQGVWCWMGGTTQLTLHRCAELALQSEGHFNSTRTG